MRTFRSSSLPARKLSRSIVDTSAQCRSSKNTTSGRVRPRSCRKAASSRFMRSCDANWASASPALTRHRQLPAARPARYHVGAICFMSIATARGHSLPLCIRLSSASSNGRYASVPARRSEQRPRAIVHGPSSGELGKEIFDQRRLANARLSGTQMSDPRPAFTD